MDDKILGVVIGLLVLAAVAGVIGIPVMSMLVSHVGATNAGEHTGYVTAVEQEGWIWKTWRAYVKTDVSSSQEDFYCVTEQSVVDELKEVAKSRELVTINYSAPFIVWNWECGNEVSIINSLIK